MTWTRSKYTVEVYCNKHQVSVHEEVLAEDRDDSFDVGVMQHEDECNLTPSNSYGKYCLTVPRRSREGWEEEGSL